MVTVWGPEAVKATQVLTLPSSSQVASTTMPSGQAVRSGSARTVRRRARHTDAAHSRLGRRPGRGAAGRGGEIAQLEAAVPEAQPGRLSGCAASTRAGSISMPTTSTSGRTLRSRSKSSTAVTGEAPYPRSTTSGEPAARRSRQAAGPASQRSIRRSRLGFVVPRVTVPTGRLGRPMPHCCVPFPPPLQRHTFRTVLKVCLCKVATRACAVEKVCRAARPLTRVAMISVHTSPLAQPGTGDAGGLNVYVAETARELARRGIDVEIFTRATAADPGSSSSPRGTGRERPGRSLRGSGQNDLPGQLCAFAAGVMRAQAARPEGWYDLVHSHYWLSGQVGWVAADRWQIPLVHTMHTMARVKNLHLAEGERPEPPAGGSVRLRSSAPPTGSSPTRWPRPASSSTSMTPTRPGRRRPAGVDLRTFHPGERMAARRALGIPATARLVLFVGRIQPLKAPTCSSGPPPKSAAVVPSGATTSSSGSSAAPVALGWSTGGAVRPRRRRRYDGPRPLRPAGRPSRAGAVVPRRRPRRRPVLQRVLRAGRHRGPGLRHACRRRPGRRPAHRRWGTPVSSSTATPHRTGRTRSRACSPTTCAAWPVSARPRARRAVRLGRDDRRPGCGMRGGRWRRGPVPRSCAACRSAGCPQRWSRDRRHRA